jgi:hypothetical protein
MDIMDEPTRRPGRPAGSGAQLPPIERNRKSRRRRAAQGAPRLDFFLDPVHAAQLLELMEYWGLDTRKDAVQRSLDLVHQLVRGAR